MGRGRWHLIAVVGNDAGHETRRYRGGHPFHHRNGVMAAVPGDQLRGYGGERPRYPIASSSARRISVRRSGTL